MKKHAIYFLFVFLLGCGSDKEQKEPIENDRIPELVELFEAKQAKAKELRNPDNGWLISSDCDAMLWTGKYSCSLGRDSDVNIRAAEYPGEPGRFDRRPPPFCWTPELGDQGSKTTWSRDMGIAGLIPHGWCSKDRRVLEDHAAFGEASNWQMGQPLADGRAIYTPPVIGLLYASIKSLGGDGKGKQSLPALYLPGLDDYQAHLQMMDIWMRGEIKDSISATMKARIDEHSDREPRCPFYRYLKGLYSGDQSATIDLLLETGEPNCSYVRSNEKEKSDLAEWLFVANLTIRDHLSE